MNQSTNQSPVISIIIVNYNVREFLLHALASIKQALKTIPHEIFVVDNASADSSVEMVRQTYPEIKLIANETNQGFSTANNQALRLAGGEYLVLINPDTVVQEDTFVSLLAFMRTHPDAGAATCKIINPDGSFSVDSRHSIPTPMTALWKQIGFHRLFPKSKTFGRYNLTYLDENETNPVDAISGSFMFIRRKTFEQIGYLDEDFFMYCEDIDYCYRITRAGWKIYYVPDSEIIHYKGESTKKDNLDYVINFNKSLYLFYRKHFHHKYVFPVGWLILIGVFIRALFVYSKNFIKSHAAFILDILLINGIILLTFMVRFELKSQFIFRDFFNHYIVINLLATVIFFITALSMDLYRRYKFSLIGIFKANFTTFFILAALTFFLNQFAFSRLVVLIAAFFSTVVMFGWRLLIRRFIKGSSNLFGRSILQRRTLLVGTDENTERIVNKMKQFVQSGFDLVGLVSLAGENIGNRINGIPIVTTLDKLKEYIRIEKIEQVIFSTHSITYETIIKTMSRIGNTGVEYKIVPQNLEVIIGKSSVERFADYPLVDIDYAIGKPFNRIAKRSLDLVLSAAILLLTFPLWLPLLTVRWLGKKKISVWGDKGERLAIFQNTGHPFKGFGNWLLTVIHIFRGQISFVGAPLHTTDNEQPYYFYKPGIWGIVQLNQDRIQDRQDEERFTLYYLKNQSIWLDLEVIFKALTKRSR